MSSPSIPPGMGGGSPMDGLSMAAAPPPQQDDQQDQELSAKMDMMLGLLGQIAEKLGIGSKDDQDQQDDQQGGGDDTFDDDTDLGGGGAAGPMKPRRSAFAGG